eukprot:Em0017g662a
MSGSVTHEASGIEYGSFENPNVVNLDKTKTTELIDVQYENVLRKIKAMMANAVSVSITTDAASMHTGDSYIAVTAHWLDAQWNMMSCVLDVSISNEEISSIVKDIVNTEFMLENRLDAIATDQGANCVAAIRQLIEEGVTEEQKHITHVLAESKYAHLVPSPEQWLAAEKLCALLKPFQIATDFLQGEKYPTLGCVSRYITTLVGGLQGTMPPVHWQLGTRWNNLPKIVLVARASKLVRCFILQDMLQRWDSADLLLGMGAITHPGHKSLSWLNCTNRQTIISQLQTEMMNITEENEEDEADEPPAKKAAVTQQEEEFDILFGHKDECPGEVIRSTHDHIEDEFLRYLKEAESDPMDWWRKHESYFPQVAKLARKYLAIPASTAPSERVFSTAKNILQKKRWSLLAERLGKCIFLRHNAKWF